MTPTRKRSTPERDLQTAVIELAQILHWRVAHFRPGRVKCWACSRGKGGSVGLRHRCPQCNGTGYTWRTAVAAQGAGFPDLVLVHQRRKRIIFAELKSDKGSVKPEQKAWLAALQAVSEANEPAHFVVAVWRPRDWNSGLIESELKEAPTAGAREQGQ